MNTTDAPIALTQDVINVLNQLPGYISIKNSDSQFVWMNDRIYTDLLDMPAPKEFTLSTDYDYPWESYAELYRQQDQQVIKQNAIKVLGPAIDNCGRTVTFICEKRLANIEFDGLPCVINTSSIIENVKLSRWIKAIQPNHHLSNPIRLLDTPHLNINDVKLTRRESECLFLLLQGYSARSMGDCLHISIRTVEKHLENLRQKLDCNNLRDVIELAYALGIANVLPVTLIQEVFQ
mgnify:CR=1 FL=1|tara:strand:+ start:2318 stop:3022 length:705 start_codon:yes stop_codon:yes gene_type:complete